MSNHFETDETQQNTESVLQNPKFVIEDFEMVHSTLKNDLIFFKRVKNTKFSMLVLYYEYELDKEKEFDNKSLLITVPSSIVYNNKLYKSNNDTNSTSYNKTNSLGSSSFEITISGM